MAGRNEMKTNKNTREDASPLWPFLKYSYIIMKHGKKYVEAKKLIDNTKAYPLAEAVALAKKVSYSKFGGSLEITIKTTANPKFNDQAIRTTTVLPNGTGKNKKIAVFIGDERQKEAKDAGADIVGYEDLLTKIKNNEIDFDILITAAELIRELAPVAKTLGPKWLMPSPKAGTLTPNIETAVEEFKKGKMEFKLDKTGNIHAIMGKIDFDDAKLVENIESFIKTIEDNKPSGVKGKLIKKIVISPSMWPGIQVEYLGNK